MGLQIDLNTHSSRSSAAKTIQHFHANPASYTGYPKTDYRDKGRGHDRRLSNTQSITQSWTIHTVSQSVYQWKSSVWFQNKLATARVPAATWLYVAGLLFSLRSAYDINVNCLHEESKWSQIEFYSLFQLLISVIYQQSNDLHLWPVTCDVFSLPAAKLHVSL